MATFALVGMWIAMAVNVFGCWLSYRRVRYWRNAFRRLGMTHAALIEATNLSDGGRVEITIGDDDTVTVTRRVREKSEMIVQ